MTNLVKPKDDSLRISFPYKCTRCGGEKWGQKYIHVEHCSIHNSSPERETKNTDKTMLADA